MKPLRYSEENFPPLTEKELWHFKKTLEDNIDLYSGDDALYLRQYIIWEMLRQTGKDCYMHKSHENILTAASKQTNIPKCILISSIGCGGTSWIVKQMLTLIGGKASFADYEKADKCISEEKSVPFVLVRPYALTDKEGKGKYFVTKKQNGTFLKSISRADVAKFILDAVTDSQWDGSPGVLLGGAKA